MRSPSIQRISAGLLPDATAHVLDDSGAIIPGLHACGNDMGSLMAGVFPGLGITLGAALTYACVALRHAQPT
jgi:FAD binding domain